MRKKQWRQGRASVVALKSEIEPAEGGHEGGTVVASTRLHSAGVSCPSVRIAMIAGVVTVLCVGGCGEDRSASSQLDARLEARLPTQQYNLIEYVCPRSAGIEDSAAQARRKRKGRDMMRALRAAWEKEPDVLVSSQRTPADGGEVTRERITLRQLVETHAEGLTPDFGVADPACVRRHQRAIKMLLDG